MKKLFAIAAVALMLLPASVLADNNVVKNGDFKEPFKESNLNASQMKAGEWYYIVNKPSTGKVKVEAAEDGEKGNVVRIENNADNKWYSGYMVQKVKLDASKGVYVLSFDAKADSEAPTVRSFIVKEAGNPKTIFISRAGFDVEDEANKNQSPASPSRMLKGKKWKNYAFEFDAAQTASTFYSPSATTRSGNPIQMEEIEGQNEFYVGIQLSTPEQAALITNIKLEPKK